MRGSIMRRWTVEEHKNILSRVPVNLSAAAAYTAYGRGTVSPQLVRYWRSIFVEQGGNMAAADRMLAAQRQFIKPEPDDDIGSDFPFDLSKPARCILVVPDQHAPYHHPDTIPFLAAMNAEYHPDLVVNLGDETDNHALSFHDSDPNLDAAGAELERAKLFLSDLHDLFPHMLICHSNHGSMHFRRAKAHGIPVQMLKRYRDVLMPQKNGAPGWHWRFGWRVKTELGDVLFKHQASGPGISDAAHNQCNLVVGHNHGNYSIEYASSSRLLYWAMSAGCLINKDELAFAYGKHTKYKPIIGAAVIKNGRPFLVPMLLGEDGRWVGEL